MGRAWLLSLLLTGCDLVYGLDDRVPVPNDEDGDRLPDVEDPCPHIADESSVDDDDDGIPIDCDPDDTDGSTLFRWFAIDAGSLDGGFLQDGIGGVDEDGFVLGDHDRLSSLVFDVDTDTAIVDVGFEIMSSSVENFQEYDWSEMGVMTVHRSFEPDRERRGDVCFVGISQDLQNETPVLEDAYLEMNEDDVEKPTVLFDPPLNGTVGTLHMLRTPSQVQCALNRPGKPTASASFIVDTLETTRGKIAISSQRMVTRLTYAWIAWQP